MTYKELEEKITPLPWQAWENTLNGKYSSSRIRANAFRQLAYINSKHEDAVFLVHCVNHFGAVVEALEGCESMMRQVNAMVMKRCAGAGDVFWNSILEDARKALAAATNIPDMGKEGEGK